MPPTRCGVVLQLCLSLLVISSVFGRILDGEPFEDNAFAARSNKNYNNDVPKPFDIEEEAVESKNVPPKPFDVGKRTFVDDVAIAGLDANQRLVLTNTLSKRSGEPDDGMPNWYWKKTQLTWILLNGPSGESTITFDDSVRDIEIALRLWSSVTPLVFTRRYSGDADLTIKFATKNHGDDFPFDGLGGVAAHAFPPVSGNTLDGDVHVDDDEVFTKDDGKYGTNFLYVITHEIGHALGLFHSSRANSIMEAFVKAGLPYDGRRLPNTDGHKIQDLYGNKPGVATIPPDPPTVAPTEPPPFNCKGDDYAATVFRGSLVILQNDRYWRFQRDNINSRLLSPPFGNLIKSYFKSLPDSVESAFTMYNGTSVYTKGIEWYLFNMRQIDGKQNGKAEHVDAAFHDERKRTTYFFKGNDFVILNHRTNSISAKMPISSEFSNLPGDLSAAYTDGEENRFFMKADTMWKFRRGSKAAEPGYPKSLPSILCGPTK